MKTAIPMKLKNPIGIHQSLLNQLLRVFCSAERYSFNRLLEKQLVDDIIKEIQDKFDLNKRYAEDAVMLAEALVSSQEKLLPIHISELETKIDNTEENIHLYEIGKKVPKKVDLETCLKGLTSRLHSLQNKLNPLYVHKEKGTLPSIIFGGKENFYKRLEGKISNEEWKELRSNMVYSRGDKSKGGNLNLRLLFENDKFFLEIAVPFGVPKGGRNPRIKLEVLVPEKFFETTIQTIIPEVGRDSKGKVKEIYTPYTIQIQRKNGEYIIHFLIEETVYGKELKWNESIQADKIAGIDMNIDRLAVSILDKQGNFIKSRVFYCHEMEYTSSDKRLNVAGETVKEVMNWLIEENVQAIVIEEIKLSQTHGTNSRVNRLVRSFAKNKFTQCLIRQALKNAFQIKLINPAYTSVIGRFKYMKKFGISVHESASFVIGRRGLGFRERIPKEMIKVLKEKVKPHLISLLGSMEETEKTSERGKKRRQKLGMYLSKINGFKLEESDWSLWNIIHKTLWLKQFEYQFKEI